MRQSNVSMGGSLDSHNTQSTFPKYRGNEIYKILDPRI